MNKKDKSPIGEYRDTAFDSLTKLGDVLPLEAPFGIMIDPANICNFRCMFCPTGDEKLLESVNRPKGIMRFDLFRKIIDDIKCFDKRIKALWLLKDGEPFINKDLERMISYAKQKRVADEIKTTSNGSLITRDRAIDIIDAGLDFIRISIEHVNPEKYREITRTFSDYERIRKNVEILFREKEDRGSSLKIHVKIVDVGLSLEEKNIFIKDFEYISDSLNIETLMGWSNTSKKDFTLGLEVELAMSSAAQLKYDRKVCPEPFKGMAVNFDGQVSVCCVDWSLGTIIGDVSKENLVDIWNGEKMYKLRNLHLKGQRNQIECCSDCQFMLGVPSLSDIDDCAEFLIKKYEDRFVQSDRG